MADRQSRSKTADEQFSAVYKAYLALDRVPQGVPQHEGGPRYFQGQPHEKYCRMPGCGTKFDSDGQLQYHLDAFHGSVRPPFLRRRARGSYIGKELHDFYVDLMRFETYPGKHNGDGQGLGEGIGANSSRPQRQQQAQDTRSHRERAPERIVHEPGADDEEEDRVLTAPTLERPPQRAVSENDGAPLDHADAMRARSLQRQQQLIVTLPMNRPLADEEVEKAADLEFRRKELGIKKRLLETELEDMQLERQLAAIKKRKNGN